MFSWQKSPTLTCAGNKRQYIPGRRNHTAAGFSVGRAAIYSFQKMAIIPKQSTHLQGGFFYAKGEYIRFTTAKKRLSNYQKMAMK